MLQHLSKEHNLGAETEAACKFRLLPAPGTINVEDFLWHQLNKASVILDVRSPEEFHEGHIPGATNLPLLDEEAHAEVGKLSRCAGSGEALKLALHRAYPGLDSLLMDARSLVSKNSSLKDPAQQQTAFVYCKRGGSRSQVVASFLGTCGFNIYTVEGGYKSFKDWTIATLEQPRKICIVAGACGSGKTEVLSNLRNQGLQVIDLEALACHRGSVFGHLGQAPQPSSEHFRNLIAMEWYKLDPTRFVYIEDEHACIGRVQMHAALYRQMRAAPVVVCLDVPFNLRVARLLKVYGEHRQEELCKAVSQFQRRMGSEKTQMLLDCISRGELQFVCETALQIYDDSYHRHMHKDRNPNSVYTAAVDTLDSAVSAAKVVSVVETLQVEKNI
mmetsp:Transcript_155367/g.289919  ORF Transcript_155367/g.289919 Transcript_155367/m.289919 type:complete len:387 (-) Transcript_155367:7-1167(-)